MLGFGRCYHMGEVMSNLPAMNDWIAAARGKPDWNRIFDGYGAAVDFPAAQYWREIADYYPDAKVLLSVRDANSWFDSVHETIMSPRLREWMQTSPFAEFLTLTVYQDFGDRIDDRKFMVDYFDQRIEAIKASVPAERLLVYQVKEGWAPLCNFLSVPVPDESFPRVNSRDETSAMLDGMMAAAEGGNLDDHMRERSKELFRTS
jgi:hypothetical protein